MLETTAGQIQADRVQSLRQVSAQCGGAITVLKGRHTLIGAFEGPVTINGSGSPHLAQGGSGDVLSGYLGGWLARKDLEAAPKNTTALAVWRHGAAADHLSAFGFERDIDSLLSTLEGNFDC
jgi:NAD(P)H-hydrate epimerase